MTPDDPDKPKTQSGSETNGAAEGRDRKERVLHTRVPAVLEAELKRLADNIRIPVSNLVRTILEDAVGVAERAGESVERELRTVAQRMEDEREKLRRAVARPDPLEGVYGFQPLVMNIHTTCVKCSVALAPGSQGHLCLSDRPGSRTFVCPQCLPGRTPGATT